MINQTRIAFIHVPKTAGSSFVQTILDNVGHDNALHMIDGLASSHIDNPYFIYGHYPFDLPDHLYPERTFERIVFFRDPLDRIVSQYNFDRDFFYAYPEKYDSGYARDIFTKDAVDFIMRAEAWYYDNVAVRLMSGVWYHLPFGTLTSQHLEKAIANLRKVSFIGFQESFQSSCEAFASLYGIEVPASPKHINVSQKTSASQAIRQDERIGPLVQFDNVLFEVAKTIADERNGGKHLTKQA